MNVDHLVLWVEDQSRALEFYMRVVGLEGVRVDAWRADQAPFPSVRISAESIIDLMPRAASELFDGVFGGEGTAGHRVHHLALAMSQAELQALKARLAAAGTKTSDTITGSFGARGAGPESFYFADPDGNVLEARWY